MRRNDAFLPPWSEARQGGDQLTYHVYDRQGLMLSSLYTPYMRSRRFISQEYLGFQSRSVCRA